MASSSRRVLAEAKQGRLELIVRPQSGNRGIPERSRSGDGRGVTELCVDKVFPIDYSLRDCIRKIDAKNNIKSRSLAP